MKLCTVFILLLTLTVFAATINLDYTLGSDAYFGIRIVPRIEFWRVSAVLDVPLGVKQEGSWFLHISSPVENLKYLDVDLKPGGVRFNAPYLVQTIFSNIDFHDHSLVAWAFDGGLGVTLGSENALFFKTSFFNACIDSEGQHHLGFTFPIGYVHVGGFVSSRGYGAGILFDPFMFFIIPGNGFRFAIERKNVYLIGQYLDQAFSISMGWIKDEEWFLLGTNGLDARIKLGQIAVVMKLQKERWYAGFSFPIVW